MGFTAIDIARDLGYNPMGLPEAPQQFERGTNLTKPGLAEVHGTEAILGKKDRSDMLSSYEQAVNQIGSILVSSSVSLLMLWEWVLKLNLTLKVQGCLLIL